MKRIERAPDHKNEEIREAKTRAQKLVFKYERTREDPCLPNRCACIDGRTTNEIRDKNPGSFPGGMLGILGILIALKNEDPKTFEMLDPTEMFQIMVKLSGGIKNLYFHTAEGHGSEEEMPQLHSASLGEVKPGCGHFAEMLKRPGEYLLMDTSGRKFDYLFFLKQKFLFTGSQSTLHDEERTKADVLKGKHEEDALFIVKQKNPKQKNKFSLYSKGKNGKEAFIFNESQLISLLGKIADILITQPSIMIRMKKENLTKRLLKIAFRHFCLTAGALAKDKPIYEVVLNNRGHIIRCTKKTSSAFSY